jgi:hypothetical protein
MRKTLLSLLAAGFVLGLGAVSAPASAEPWDYGPGPAYGDWHEREWRRAEWERHRHWEEVRHWRQWHHEGERW